jgi:pilus assembly protein Flp/PilA
MVEFIKSFFAQTEETEGQGLVEYALIIFLVAIFCIGALTLLGGAVEDVFTQITTAL